jgi:hypothetical protein
MAQQTAVEWLVEQLIPKAMVTYDTTTYNAIQQAKAMEKEQITFAYNDGANNMVDGNYKGMDHYYNETYNK